MLSIGKYSIFNPSIKTLFSVCMLTLAARFELAADSLEGCCSIQLSYASIKTPRHRPLCRGVNKEIFKWHYYPCIVGIIYAIHGRLPRLFPQPRTLAYFKTELRGTFLQSVFKIICLNQKRAHVIKINEGRCHLPSFLICV